MNAAADAQLTIGSGPGAFTVTSGSNVVSGLLAGVTLTLLGTDDRTGDGLDRARRARPRRQGAGARRRREPAAPDDRRRSPRTTRRRRPRSRSPVTSRRPQLANASRARSKTRSAGSASSARASSASPPTRTATSRSTARRSSPRTTPNPTGVAEMFTQGGSSANPDVTFISAADATQGGVVQRERDAARDAGDLDRAERHVADRRRSSIAREGRHEPDLLRGEGDRHAGRRGQRPERRVRERGPRARGDASTAPASRSTPVGYGHNAQFDVAWDGTNFSTFTGTDVAGTINGVTATGNGQQLLVPFATPGFGGLALNITGTTLGDLGTFTYSPGIAQRVSTAVNDATDAVTGYITHRAERPAHDQIKSFNDDDRRHGAADRAVPGAPADRSSRTWRPSSAR